MLRKSAQLAIVRSLLSDHVIYLVLILIYTPVSSSQPYEKARHFLDSERSEYQT